MGKYVSEVAARVETLLAESARWTGGKQQLTATRLHAMLVVEGKQVGVTVIKAAVAEWPAEGRKESTENRLAPAR